MPLNVFDEEYWLPCKDFPLHSVSSFGRIHDIEFDEDVPLRYSSGAMRAVFKYGPNEFRGAIWQMMYATFWREGWGIGVDVAYRDDDPKNLSIFNLQFSRGGKPLLYRLDGETGLWQRKRKMARQVRVVETGEIFNSVNECAAAVGGYPNTIYMCLRGAQATSKGLHYEWVED